MTNSEIEHAVADRAGRQLAVEYRPLDALVPYARNARTHSDAQVAEIAGSIREFGFTNPVLIGEDGTLIAGHGRVLAARKLGMETVPAIVLSGLSETQRRALVLADNRIAMNAGWDEELLALELSDLQEAGFDLGLTGFEDGELDRLLSYGSDGDGDDGGVPPVVIPEPPRNPASRPGDLWLLGDHRLLCGEAERMVAASSALQARITRTVNNLAVLPTSSWFRPLSADASKMDGLNIHFAAVDEVHEHPGPEIIQKLNTATGSRRQPLIFEITTAGYDRHSVCRQHHEFSVKALEGTVPFESADSWFGFIATIDEGDDWTDERVWAKANPSLGVTVKLDDLKRQIDEAKEMPAQQNAIRRLRLNEWTEQVTRWLDMAVWEEGGLPSETDWRIVRHDLDELEQKLHGRECYGGLDLARVNDLSAFVLLFPPTLDAELGPLADKWIVLCRFFIPEDDILRRVRRDRVPYDVWRDQGFLTATPGNATDFAFIEAAILDLAARFDMRELSYDRTFAGEIVQHLQDEGLNLVQFGQGFLSMAAPTAELERLSVSRSLWHGGHPVLAWNASNVTVRHDPAGNIKPDKERSTERIDGIVATCNALGRALMRDVNAGRSVYQTRGALVL